ncbi:MAG TPA: ABC transporter permease [Myxococcota bacterium]|nr:ABC transporter permease [Myxococcota bacterium]
MNDDATTAPGRGSRTPAGFAMFTGALAMTTASATFAILRGRIDYGLTLRQLRIVTIESLPVMVLVALLGGLVMVFESAGAIEVTGADGLLGWAFGLATLSEVAPILVALMFAARSGARTTAEMGTKCVTGQIDAMRLLGVDPVPYLSAPVFVAMVPMLPLMIALCDVCAIFAGAAGAALVVGIPADMFFISMVEGRLLDELLMGLVKGFFFGGAIAAVSCTLGLGIRGGASGVGHAVNDCVVYSAVGIFIFDLLVDLVWLMAGA